MLLDLGRFPGPQAREGNPSGGTPVPEDRHRHWASCRPARTSTEHGTTAAREVVAQSRCRREARRVAAAPSGSPRPSPGTHGCSDVPLGRSGRLGLAGLARNQSAGEQVLGVLTGAHQGRAMAEQLMTLPCGRWCGHSQIPLLKLPPRPFVCIAGFCKIHIEEAAATENVGAAAASENITPIGGYCTH